MTLEVIILAAGEGTRMRSKLPKVLHAVGGRPMLAHVIEVAGALNPSTIHVVIGHGSDQVRSAIESDPIVTERTDTLNWVIQAEQLGTGHAVMQAMPAVSPDSTILVLYGDVPMIRSETLQQLVSKENQIALLTATMTDPTGLGRIIRDQKQRVIQIVEQKDASDQQKQISECNTGFLAGPASLITSALGKLDDNNAQQEFYLTDVIGHSVAEGIDIADCQPRDEQEVLGINSQRDLATVERAYQLNRANSLMAKGVTLRDPARFDVRGHCSFGSDCVVDINVILEGEVQVGEGCTIGANTIIRNSRIGNHCMIDANCVIDSAEIGNRCRVGPFARLRPEAKLDDEVHIGNFVEIKKSRIGRGSKANHLAYVGDSTVGKGTNIGAGVITCNYDGAYKHQTVIGDDVFIGSNSQLVAPVTIEDGATIGAGSTVTQNVPAETLAVSRSKQRMIDNWERPVKK